MRAVHCTVLHCTALVLRDDVILLPILHASLIASDQPPLQLPLLWLAYSKVLNPIILARTYHCYAPPSQVGGLWRGVWPQQHALWEGHLPYMGIFLLHMYISPIKNRPFWLSRWLLWRNDVNVRPLLASGSVGYKGFVLTCLWLGCLLQEWVWLTMLLQYYVVRRLKNVNMANFSFFQSHQVTSN